jgi:hypothetical protein
MRIVVWQEQDAMRQRKIDFGVIPGSFRDKKNAGAALPPRALTAIFVSTMREGK